MERQNGKLCGEQMEKHGKIMSMFKILKLRNFRFHIFMTEHITTASLSIILFLLHRILILVNRWHSVLEYFF